MKRNLNRTIKQAFQLHSGKEVTAFVVMALDKDGNIVKHTTNDVQQCTDGIFASDAEECLRVAHKTSVLQARCDHDLKGMPPPPKSSTLANIFYRPFSLERR